jgi:hypothetical protein
MQAPQVAQRLGAEGFVGVEHIFLAILEEGESVPAQVMVRLGITDGVKAELHQIVESDEYRGVRPSGR